MGTDFHSEESELVERLVHGDADAFTKLYTCYGGKLYTHLLRMTKSEEISREILQDVFLRIWEFRPKIDISRPFGALLYRIAENRVYDHFRSLAREKRVANILAGTSVGFHTDTENNLAYTESLNLLTKGIGQLPPTRRRVYQLCKLEGKSYEETAELLGISPSTVNDHVVKANRFLKKLFKQQADTVVFWTLLFSTSL